MNTLRESIREKSSRRKFLHSIGITGIGVGGLSAFSQPTLAISDEVKLPVGLVEGTVNIPSYELQYANLDTDSDITIEYVFTVDGVVQSPQSHTVSISERNGSVMTGDHSIDLSTGEVSLQIKLTHNSVGTVETPESAVTTIDNKIPSSGVSRWKLEQDFVDTWGNNDGLGKNAPSFSPNSVVGDYALDLTGSEWVDIGTPSNMSFTASDPFTISLWVEADSWSGPNNRSHWFSSRDGDNNWSAIFSIDSSRLLWRVGGDSNSAIVDVSAPESGQYTMLTGTYDGNGNIEFYIDGTSVGTDSASLSGNLYKYWNIGQREDYDRVPDGRIDDPRTYSKELSATEVSNLYTTGSING